MSNYELAMLCVAIYSAIVDTIALLVVLTRK